MVTLQIANHNVYIVLIDTKSLVDVLFCSAYDQVEVANKVIKHHLKMRLGSYKGVWVDELLSLL